MFNPATEMLLTQYYLLNAVFDKHFTDKKSWFYTFGRAFGLSEDETAKLFAKTEEKSVKAVSTEKEYLRHIRVKKYMSQQGIASDISAEFEELITVKGSAILLLTKYGLNRQKENTATSVCDELLQYVKNGNIIAMRLYAIARIEGIALQKDYDEGIKLLEETSKWLDVASIILLHHYSQDNILGSTARLLSATKGTPYDRIALTLSETDCTENGLSQEDELISKAFSWGILKRDEYSERYAKIAFNKNIDFNEREKLILSCGKDHITVASALPLNLDISKKIEFDFTDLDLINNERDNEKTQIKKNLINSDLRIYEGYKPLCVVSDSLAVLEMYEKSLSYKLNNCNPVFINISDCTDQEFEMTYNNIFVTACKQDLSNVYFIACVGKLTDKVIKGVQEILRYSTRAAFKLKQPAITLNLSTILPICFCDKQNAKHFKPYCDMVNAVVMSENELKGEIFTFIKSREEIYGISKIHISDDLLGTIMELGIDSAKNVLDRAIIGTRNGNGEIELKLDAVSEYIKETKTKFLFGFGGANV